MLRLSDIYIYIYIYIYMYIMCSLRNYNNEFILRENKMADFKLQQLEIGLEFVR